MRSVFKCRRKEPFSLVVARAAPRSARRQLPFAVWVALAKATPVAGLNEDVQGLLGEGEAFEGVPGD